MGQEKCSDAEFMALFDRHGATKAATLLGSTERGVYARRRRLENKYDVPLSAPSRSSPKEYSHRPQVSVKNGCVIIGSDFHIWPGSESVALRAFKKLCKEMKPAAVILNGDVLDFPKISRHPPIGWESAPTPLEEIEAGQDHLHEIAQASGRARKIWTLGNHDARFETRLATVATEYRGIKGIHLSDHFPLWEKGWACLINQDVMVKHRFRAGVHAPHNNTVNAGISMVTGHMHSAKVSPFTDYRGTRYGVDSGCIADIDHKAFVDYSEDNPKNWVSGFCVLTFSNGALLMPELVTKFDDKHMQFRGALIRA